jgi:hypothetical protein
MEAGMHLTTKYVACRSRTSPISDGTRRLTFEAANHAPVLCFPERRSPFGNKDTCGVGPRFLYGFRRITDLCAYRRSPGSQHEEWT